MATKLRSLACLLTASFPKSKSYLLQQTRGNKNNIFSRDTSEFDHTLTRPPRNFYLDAWIWRREKLRHEFTFKDRQASWEMLIAYVFIPTIVWRFFAWTIQLADDESGRPRRAQAFYDDYGPDKFYFKYAEDL